MAGIASAWLSEHLKGGILSLYGETHPLRAAGQSQGSEHVLPGWMLTLQGPSLGWRRAGCMSPTQHTQPALIPQAWRAQKHPPWPRPDYSGINHADYMLPKKDVLFLFRAASDLLLVSSSLKLLFSASSCLVSGFFRSCNNSG